MPNTAAQYFLWESLALQHFLDIGESARILGLAQPEDRLLANREVGIGVGNVDQLRHTLFLGQLADGEDRFLLDLNAGVVLDGSIQGSESFLARLLRQPKKSLAADMAVAVCLRHLHQIVDRTRV